MYTAHRGMGVPAQPSSRLTELLDQVRTEFDGERNKIVEYEQNRKFAWMFLPVCTGYGMRCSVALSLESASSSGASQFIQFIRVLFDLKSA